MVTTIPRVLADKKEIMQTIKLSEETVDKLRYLGLHKSKQTLDDVVVMLLDHYVKPTKPSILDRWFSNWR